MPTISALRPVLAGAALSLALAAVPATALAAQPDPAVSVCNEAGMAFVGGPLDVLDPATDPNPPARHKTGLDALPGVGKGLVNAASHSPALAVCGVPASTDGGGDGTGGTGGGTGGGPSGDNG